MCSSLPCYEYCDDEQTYLSLERRGPDCFKATSAETAEGRSSTQSSAKEFEIWETGSELLRRLPPDSPIRDQGSGRLRTLLRLA